MCEPWCWTPEEVRGLTLEEVDRVRRAQAARVEQMRAESEAQAPGAAVDAGLPDEPQVPTRAGFVALMTGQFGMTRERAEQLYEAQMARHQARKGGS